MLKYKFLGQVWTPREIAEFMLDKINLDFPNLRILEPACGEGIFLEVLVNRLKGRSYEIHCVDIDKKALEIAQRKFYNNPNIKFFYMDFLKKFKGFGYDIIISNPPYIRIQNIPDGYKDFLFNNFKFCRGDTDIFYAFIEKSLRILNNKGYLAFIIPNSWLWSKAGEPFRNFLMKMEYNVEVYDFDHFQIFSDVSTYVSIIILRKEKGLYGYYRFDGSGFEGKTLSWHKVRYFKVVDNEIVEMVQSQPLKIGDIRVGIATLCDRVFIFEPEGEDKNFYLYKGFKIEKSITKEIIKNSKIKSHEDIKNNRLRIIFPYKSGKLIKENVLKEEFPNAYEYLLNHKEKLLKRDKGKKIYENWYAFGRTQGIKTLFGKKILTPAFSKKPNFVYCDKEEALFYAGYGIFNPPYDFDVVEKILNSSLIESYMNTISKPYRNNWRSYSKAFLEKIRLPILNPDEIDKLKNTTKKEEIDEFVLWLYKRKGFRGSVKGKLL
ncbi:MAG: Eco57I restriction-modification methylase domain-containing protein [candidate division WOR-3 bacterium]